jgi:integration host factor subunit alpha
MTKAEIAEKVYQKIGFSINTANTIVNEIFELIKEAARKGEMVKISGFGVFLIKKRKGRTGHNPKTGEKVNISPLKILKFRPTNTLKKRVTNIPDKI